MLDSHPLSKSLVEAFLAIFFIRYGSFLALNLDRDNISYLLTEEMDYINSEYSSVFHIFINTQNDIVFSFKSLINTPSLWNDLLKLISLLQWRPWENILSFIDLNFTSCTRDFIFPFFDFIYTNSRESRESINSYIDSLHNFKLKKLLSFVYYGIGNDTEYNTNLSISILSEIIDRYPLFSSFYLLRMRQRFNLVYKILIWVNQFNKLLTSLKWRQIIYSNQYIIDCFSDLDWAYELFPNNPTYYMFKWKFLLHLLDYQWLPLLVKFLKMKGKLFDDNIFSWFGVYYLQMWDAKAAKPYLELVHYSESDRYKAYSKLLFLYVKWWYKEEFFSLFNGIFKGNVEILLYDRGSYYWLTDWELVKIENISDSYNHKDKMWFKLDNFDSIMSNEYSDANSYLEAIYFGISRNYHDHWSSELHRKVVFYSRDNFLFWHASTSYFH